MTKLARICVSIAGYAVADMRSEPLVTMLIALLYCAILAPLVLIYVVKAGIITAWADSLAQDTRNREVRIRGEYALDQAAMDEISALPETGFVVGEPAFVVRSWRWRKIEPHQGPLVELDLRTTAAGDPVFSGTARVPAGFAEVALSGPAAAALETTAGDKVAITLRRTTKDGTLQTIRLALRVATVLPETDWVRRAAFVSPDLARAIEEFSWFVVTPGPDWPTGVAMPEAPWKSARVYAASIRDAPILRDRLIGLGFEAGVETDQIEHLLSLEAGLTRLFAAIVSMTSAGFAAASFLLQWVGVSRKRAALALLALSGFRRWHVALFPIVQALLATTVGALMSIGLLAMLYPTLSRFVAQHADGAALTLPPVGTWGLGYLAVAAIGVLGCVGAVVRIANLDITETLRSD